MVILQGMSPPGVFLFVTPGFFSLGPRVHFVPLLTPSQSPPLRLQPIPHTSAHNVRPESTQVSLSLAPTHRADRAFQRHPQTFLSTKPSREQFMPPV